MTAKRFTVDSDGKYWDIVSKKYVTIDHLFYVVEKMEKENEQLRTKNNAYIQDIEVFKEENTHLKLKNEELKQFIQELTTKGTGKILLANGSIYKVDAILTDIKGGME